MPKKPLPHPLAAWLAKKGLKAYVFADKHKMSRRPLYSHIAGGVKHPSLRIMEAIEKATRGAVSVDAQIKWSQKHRKKAAPRDAYVAPEPPIDPETVFDEPPEAPDDPIDDDADNGDLGLEP